MLELWDAARVLQIPSLVQKTEFFVGQMVSSDSFETVYTKARQYRSHGVICNVKSFLLGMFEDVYYSGQLRILTYEELYFLVKSDQLRVENEDIVLRSIFQWVEHFEMKVRTEEAGQGDLEDSSPYGHGLCSNISNLALPEEATSKLASLLRASRYGLASLECLNNLSKHPLCQNDREATLVITDAITYKQDNSTHGYRPPYAIQRALDHPDIHHVGALAEINQVSIMILQYNHWFKLPICPLHAIITNLFVFDDQLYVTSKSNHESLIFVYNNKEWKFVIDLPNNDFIVVAKGSCIYLIDGTSSSVNCVSPRETPVLHSEIKFPDMMRNPESALDFDKSILIFCSTDSVERSTVISLEVPQHKWTDCGHLKGSSKNLVGFRNENNYFILQRDGSLSQVLRNEVDSRINIILIKRLWSIQNSLRGAFIHKDYLFLFGNAPIKSSCLRGVSGLFWNIEYWYRSEDTSNFVQMCMHEDNIWWNRWATFSDDD
ncbi:uncharacterized protein LOC129922195 [Biomphalaria glabrata]|uniref:Uncharacterized protein LOC129922195 n=1 Tax=Biomphalaria glabrata TaxID=6526 RepID=A0A9W2YKB2_BIOGL|nr:uncharacterized protein LOC129922195 [Biomphalaria glabrata]